MENPPYVTYQPYKSKRHNRNSSIPQSIVNEAPLAVQSRPVSNLINGQIYSETAISLASDGPLDAEKRSIAVANGRAVMQRPVSMIDSLPHLRQEQAQNLLIAEAPVAKPPPAAESVSSPAGLQSSSSPTPTPPHSPLVTSPPTMVAALPSTPSSSTNSPKANGKSIALSVSPVAGPSSVPTSTFRRVPLRLPATRSAHPSSPLRPASMIITGSSSLSPRTTERTLGEPRSGMSSAVSSPSIPAQDPPVAVAAVPTRSSSLMTSPASEIMPTSQPTSVSPSPAITPSTSTSSALPVAGRAPARSAAPYRPGFQPKGVYRPRTDEFVEARNRSRDVGRIEHTRLERRLEKLINLHFPQPGHKEEVSADHRTTQRNRRASSIWDLDLSDLRTKSAGDLWREVVQSQGAQNSKNDIRAAEQKITPWEEDSVVSQCPLCSSTFHPLTNRKHHCRLCGRIICSLPVKFPQRPQTCSLLFVVDQKTGRIEEVGEGVDYGVRRRTVSTTGKNPRNAKPTEVLNDDEKFLKGVRICHDCRPQQQYRHEMASVPLFARLYETFISLEKEIEEELPIFQEVVVNLSKQERPTPEAIAARKRLLEAFEQYDALAKRMRKLPCVPGSSQDRIHGAILVRASNFLQKNMFPLQSLPNPKKAPSGSNPANDAPPPDEQIIDPDSEVARVLQPLLEQEALLETFVEEAKAHRKFEDVKTLKRSLREIRDEIERILQNAEERAAPPAPAQRHRRTSTRTSNA
ncbi:FYVE-domain-containing protein [Epithele typhae]|uniref:FYVE-domain-containing protein n=1 Tax=Epithele typhae TaxID=378194 RepID=UPI0020086ED3|nr:FYVE-domain-containing protein [Epithele typhae]KAH9945939.1 FYVE-domain-containing protein [Epithele typhae]